MIYNFKDAIIINNIYFYITEVEEHYNYTYLCITALKKVVYKIYYTTYIPVRSDCTYKRTVVKEGA